METNTEDARNTREKKTVEKPDDDGGKRESHRATVGRSSPESKNLVNHHRRDVMSQKEKRSSEEEDEDGNNNEYSRFSSPPPNNNNNNSDGRREKEEGGKKEEESVDVETLAKKGAKRQNETDDDGGATKNVKRKGRPVKDATGLTIVELKKQAREEAKAAGGGKVMHQSWTTEEDNRLAALVERFGSKKWSFVAQLMCNRRGKQCRDRYINHLSPSIKKGEWTTEEEMMIVEGHRSLGTRWAALAKVVPGRPENAVKNHWYACKRTKFEPKALLRPLYRYQLRELNIVEKPPTKEALLEAKEKLGGAYPGDEPVALPKEAFASEVEKKKFEAKLATLSQKKRLMGVDYTLDAVDDEEEKEDEDEDTNERVEASDSPAKEKERLEKLLKEHREKELREKQERQQYLLDQQLKRRPIPKEAKSVRSNTKRISPTMEEMNVEIKSNALVNAVKNELDNQAAAGSLEQDNHDFRAESRKFEGILGNALNMDKKEAPKNLPAAVSLRPILPLPKHEQVQVPDLPLPKIGGYVKPTWKQPHQESKRRRTNTQGQYTGNSNNQASLEKARDESRVVHPPRNGGTDDDGYNWHKYGEKQLKHDLAPRSYYKCTFRGCPAKKTVTNGAPVYINEHTHDKVKASFDYPEDMQIRKRELDLILAAAEEMDEETNMEHEEEEEKREEDNNNDDESEEYTEIDEETDPAVLEERRVKWLEQQLFGDAKRTKLVPTKAAAFQEDLLQQEQEPKKKRKYRKGPCMLCGTKITPCWRSVGDLKLCNACGVRIYRDYTVEKEEAGALLELSKGLGGAKSKPLKGAVRAANKKVPNRIKNDQQDIERFALNKYPKLKLVLTTNLKTTGFKTGETRGRPRKVGITEQARNIVPMPNVSRGPPTRKRTNYKKRVILLDEIVNDDDDDVAEAAATLHQQQGRNLNQNTNSLFHLPIKKRRYARVNEDGMFTAIDTVTNEDIPKYMDDMQRSGSTVRNPLRLLASSVSLRLDDDVNRESETLPATTEVSLATTSAATVAATTADSMKFNNDVTTAFAAQSEQTTTETTTTTTVTMRAEPPLRPNEIQEQKETIVVDAKLQQPQPQQKAHSKCDIVKDFIEVTEFPLDINRCVNAVRSRSKSLEVASLTSKAARDGPIQLRGPKITIPREKLVTGLKRIASNAREKITQQRRKNVGINQASFERNPLNHSNGRCAISIRQNSCMKGDLQMAIVCSSENFRDAINCAEECAVQIKEEFDFENVDAQQQ